MKFIFETEQGEAITGSILFQYTNYEGEKPVSMFAVKTESGEVKHIPVECLVGCE